MKYKVGERKENTIEVEFTLDAKEWEQEVEKAYQKNKGKYKKEGFRQGKVPRKVLEQTYGEYLFYEDAFNDCCPIYYGQMLDKEKKIFPVDYPDVSIKSIDDKGVVFVAKITVYPEVTIGEYKGIVIKKAKSTVSAAEVNAELDALREKQARFVEVTDREAKLGDLINLDYSGSADGVVFEGGTAKNQELELGSHSFIEGFEDQMVGMKIGEEKDINVTFPENYHAEGLKGKPAVFHVKLLGIREKQMPEINDDFAKDVSEFDTLEEYKADIKKNLEEKKADAAKRAKEDAAVDAAIEKASMEIPDAMLDTQVSNMIEDFARRIQSQGLTMEQYLQFTGMTPAALQEQMKPQALKRIQSRLVLEKIAEVENIQISDEKLDEEIAQMAEMYKMEVEKLKEVLGDAEKEQMKKDLAVQEAVTLIAEAAVEVEKTEE